VSRDEVVNHFQQYGPIKSCVLLTHKDSGKPKGCAMVLYHKWAHAGVCISVHLGGKAGCKGVGWFWQGQRLKKPGTVGLHHHLVYRELLLLS
jgi:hypothetical protein